MSGENKRSSSSYVALKISRVVPILMLFVTLYGNAVCEPAKGPAYHPICAFLQNKCDISHIETVSCRNDLHFTAGDHLNH
jgi:hypothetical protein